MAVTTACGLYTPQGYGAAYADEQRRADQGGAGRQN